MIEEIIEDDETDEIIFETEQDFIEHVENNPYCLVGKEETIAHEREHFYKAIELGYFPSYGFTIKIFPFYGEYHISIIKQDSKQFFEDMINIASYPKNLSKGDLELIEECNKKLDGY